ncbi:MAG: adenylate/guanylate cyclase domain-containing protein [Acidimicrobiales bacterium]
MTVCASCGHELPEGAKFCLECGAPVTPAAAPREQRKTVTVLFCDVAGSTALGEATDPEALRALLARYFERMKEIVERHGGSVEKFVGDAVMAVFGLPHAHEDDALRAVRAGLAICARTRRLKRSMSLDSVPLDVRVGIQSGDVATGIRPNGQLLVTGPAVNAAARLQAAAVPGEVLVGEMTRALTAASVAFGEPRDVAAKGFDLPIAAHPVRSLTTLSARRTIPLVGRQPELTLLRDTLARVESSRRPHLFTILGEPGVGKTRLLEELIAGAPDKAQTLLGRIQPPDWGSTFSALTEMLQRLAGVDDDDDPDKAHAALEKAVEWYVDPDDEECGSHLAVATRLALARGPEEGRDESTFVQEVRSGFVTLLDRLSRHGPVVAAFDGVEHAGPSLLDLIEHVTRRSPRFQRPVLVVATGRPELLDARPTWGASADSHTMMRLDPLDADASVELARQAGSGRVRSETAAGIASRAGGNPFFIIEMTGMLIRGNGERPHLAAVALPPTVQAVVAARLDQLPASRRELVRKAAVFVFSFDRSELALVADVPEGELLALEDAEVLVHDEGARPRWRFRHETLRDVAYGSLTKRERLRLHLQIADGLIAQGRRPAWAADHLERAARASLDLYPADRALPDRAADALAEAADRARRRMESRTAVERYERSLAMAGPEEGWGRREARILAGLGEAHYWLGSYPEARRALCRAEELGQAAGDDWALSVALRFQGDIVLNTDQDYPAARGLLWRALDAAERSGDGQAITRTLLFCGWLPWTLDDFEEAEVLWRRALGLAHASGDRWAEIRALTSLAASVSEREDFANAGELARQAMAVATELGDRFSMAIASVQLGRSRQDDGHGEEALPHFDRGLAVFEELGARWEQSDALRTRGVVLRELGRLDEAEADLVASLRVSQGLGESMLTRWTWLALARVADRRGDREAADERRRNAERLAPAAGG